MVRRMVGKGAANTEIGKKRRVEIVRKGGEGRKKEKEKRKEGGLERGEKKKEREGKEGGREVGK